MVAEHRELQVHQACFNIYFVVGRRVMSYCKGVSVIRMWDKEIKLHYREHYGAARRLIISQRRRNCVTEAPGRVEQTN